MILRVLLCVSLGFWLGACSTPKKKDANKIKPPSPELADLVNDPDFQAFVSRLQKAVAAHDVNTLADMMTPNFGYRLDPVGEGDGVFKYWDDELLWPQLQAVLSRGFAVKGNYFVAPPEFATDPNFHGYRAGITPVNGTWKFAYFVTE